MSEHESDVLIMINEDGVDTLSSCDIGNEVAGAIIDMARRGYLDDVLSDGHLIDVGATAQLIADRIENDDVSYIDSDMIREMVMEQVR